MAGRSIADIYDRGVIFTEVKYRGYGPTYCATHNLYIMVSAQQTNVSKRKGQKNFCIVAIFCSSLSHIYGTPP